MFSLGVVLYKMLCGRRPFSGDDAAATLAATLASAPVRPRHHSEGDSRRRRARRPALPREETRVPVSLDRRAARRAPPPHDVEIGQPSPADVRLSWEPRSSWSSARRAWVSGRYVQSSRVQWVEQEAVPEMTRLLNEDRLLAAATIYRRAEQYAPTSQALLPLMDGVSPRRVRVSTTPAGARVYISDLHG